MRNYLTAFRITALLGFAAGAAVGFAHRSPFWRELSWQAMVRESLFGWLIGTALAFPAGWLLSRRDREPAGARPRWRRAVGRVTLALAFAPVALVLLAIPRDSFSHRALTLGRARGETRPNLILISVDALRADFLGAYGSAKGLTPNLDAFARQATRYDSAWAGGPWTLPSLGSLITLLPPSWSGLEETPGNQPWAPVYAALADDTPLISERLRDAGYGTGAALTNVFLCPERGWTRGFDDFWNEMVTIGTPEPVAGERVTAAASDWLALHRGRPFFLWVHYLDTHSYNAPTTPKAVRARYSQWRRCSRDLWEVRFTHSDARTKALYQSFCRAMYAEEVRYVDGCVGKLLAEIKARGLWDQSLIAITADHGEELFDHGGLQHGHSMYREVLQVPLLVKWPKGVRADRRIPQTVGLPSLGATLLECARLATGRGRDAPPLPRRRGPGQEVYAEGIYYGQEQTALTTDQWRVMYRPLAQPPTPQFEVYDRRKDPWEKVDLARTQAASDLRERLRRLTHDAQQAVAARAARQTEPRRPVLTDKAARQLKALGYLE